MVAVVLTRMMAGHVVKVVFLMEIGSHVARSMRSKLLYMEVIVLQKNSESLLQRSCEGMMLLQVTIGEVKSFTVAKLSLLLLVLALMRSASAVRLVS